MLRIQKSDYQPDIKDKKGSGELPLAPLSKQEFSPLRGAGRIALIYLVLGSLWILFTDRAVAAIVSDEQWIVQINMIKGWFFVFTTAVLIFGLIFRMLAEIKRKEAFLELSYKDAVGSHERLEAAYEEIIATEDELRLQYSQLIENQRKLAESEEKLQHLAYHDPLTGLPNRLALFELAGKGLLEAESRAALLFVDIDNFKYINDTLGHAFGDQLIHRTGRRLEEIVGERGGIYRFGGDEFIVLLALSREEADAAAAEILSAFKETVDIDGSLLRISMSMGMSLYPEHGKDIQELVKYADIAMYQAKSGGKSTCVVFESWLTDSFAERMQIENRLYAAMENKEFHLVYQPQVDPAGNRVTGLEALVRWDSPELGQVSPMRFIKVAEDTRFIIPLGAWILEEACRCLKGLREKGFCDLTLSVNISTPQLLQTDFYELVLDTLASTGLSPRDLELELTETVLLESYDHVLPKLSALKDRQVGIALDDFGTGYSSLSYLTHLPISTLKIDKSFIDLLSTDHPQASLVEEIIRISRRMNLSVVAEGVETRDQLDRLAEQGCDRIQGYYFSRPLPPEELEAFLAGWSNHSGAAG
ncbi:bifunctional diguanylate cyclase/phosphodiesterase [Paenibacillus sp. YN15]|uniref:putative bifunctional diguanylate cyclase/phosphodiesterase n=1 Tax=Paenibacillus sp. YN15 TaxID=1742774 RepID=UPI0015EB7B36|nr:GGDEF domain-containing phosphodiesterase [Paenibacillus sp. YN15]